MEHLYENVFRANELRNYVKETTTKRHTRSQHWFRSKCHKNIIKYNETVVGLDSESSILSRILK